MHVYADLFVWPDYAAEVNSPIVSVLSRPVLYMSALWGAAALDTNSNLYCVSWMIPSLFLPGSFINKVQKVAKVRKCASCYCCILNIWSVLQSAKWEDLTQLHFHWSSIDLFCSAHLLMEKFSFYSFSYRDLFKYIFWSAFVVCKETSICTLVLINLDCSACCAHIKR